MGYLKEYYKKLERAKQDKSIKEDDYRPQNYCRGCGCTLPGEFKVSHEVYCQPCTQLWGIDR